MKSFILSVAFFHLTFISLSQITNDQNYIQVLGIVQDAGFPHIGCEKDCCLGVSPGEYFVSCIGLVDKKNKKRYLFDATPDLHNQLRILENFPTSDNIVDGIFLTHAHIGHYTGLMYLGREGLGGNEINVFALERMSNFLQNNGPWDQLVNLKNISLNSLENLQPVNLSKDLKVIPIKVPHRDEYSETVCYLVSTMKKKLLYIPDIDKWHLWDKDIKEMIKIVDYALLDGTFYQDGELSRDMSKIPHPFVKESMILFKDLSKQNKQKVFFTHLNHTNPLIIKESKEQFEVKKLGFNFAMDNLVLEL